MKCCAVDDELLSDSLEELQEVLPDTLSRRKLTKQLKKSLRRFCIDSEIWRYAFEVVQVAEGERLYLVPERDDSVPVRVVELFEVDACGKERRISERRNIQRGEGQFWYSPEPDKILLNEVPCGSMTLRANVALKPVRGSERFPEALYGQWDEAIEAGALARFFAMPSKDWTDYKQAEYRSEKYAALVAKAKQFHLHNLKRGRPVYRNELQAVWR